METSDSDRRLFGPVIKAVEHEGFATFLGTGPWVVEKGFYGVKLCSHGFSTIIHLPRDHGETLLSLMHY